LYEFEAEDGGLRVSLAPRADRKISAFLFSVSAPEELIFSGWGRQQLVNSVELAGVLEAMRPFLGSSTQTADHRQVLFDGELAFARNDAGMAAVVCEHLRGFCIPDHAVPWLQALPERLVGLTDIVALRQSPGFIEVLAESLEGRVEYVCARLSTPIPTDISWLVAGRRVTVAETITVGSEALVSGLWSLVAMGALRAHIEVADGNMRLSASCGGAVVTHDIGCMTENQYMLNVPTRPLLSAVKRVSLPDVDLRLVRLNEAHLALYVADIDFEALVMSVKEGA
jgi:primosomal replication protein N